MENITIGQIGSAIGVIVVIAGFFGAILRWYKSHITDKFEKYKSKFFEHKVESEKEFRKIYQEIAKLDSKTRVLDKEIEESKEERLILLKSQLACLKGLHDDLHCNGPVTQGISELEDYLIKKSHQ